MWQANQLARSPEFRRLAVAIANELERVEVLTAQDLEALIATAEETWSTEVCRCGCEGSALRGGSVGELGPEHCALSVFAS